MKETTAIIGATSGIARALARECAGCGDDIVLAARDKDQLRVMKKDLQTRYSAQIGIVLFDALDFGNHSEYWKQICNTEAGEPTRVVFSYGYMADQNECQHIPEKARRTFEVNLISVASLLELVAFDFAKRGNGTIVVISSVAGDRGRAANYIYGASKAGLTAYAAGLRNRLYKHGVHVLTVKPGFVDTLMTKGIIDPNSPLVATPKKAALDICKAMDRKKNIVYTKWLWRIIMAIICIIPESIFKHLKI